MVGIDSVLATLRHTEPMATANHSVASLIKTVAATASALCIPFHINSVTITASVPPRPPGIKLTAPANIASAYTNVANCRLMSAPIQLSIQ